MFAVQMAASFRECFEEAHAESTRVSLLFLNLPPFFGERPNVLLGCFMLPEQLFKVALPGSCLRLALPSVIL